MSQVTSLEAERIWRAIPKSTQDLILKSVWCRHCRTSTTMNDYSAEIIDRSLILTGKCQSCDQVVRRVID